MRSEGSFPRLIPHSSFLIPRFGAICYNDRMGEDAMTRKILVVGDGRLALDLARQRNPDLIVLDLMLPQVDGLDVCRILRAESRVPIIMLTARTTEDDKLLG